MPRCTCWGTRLPPFGGFKPSKKPCPVHSRIPATPPAPPSGAGGGSNTNKEMRMAKKNTEPKKSEQFVVMVETHDGSLDKYEIALEEGQKIFFGTNHGELTFGVETTTGDFVKRCAVYAAEYWSKIYTSDSGWQAK